MTKKRFTTSDTDILCMTIIDNENGKHYGFARDIAIVMNDLNDENKQLKEQNKELKSNNDIKFWKHQFMMNYNAFYIIMHEISRAIDGGYEVSEEFQKYLNELKARNSENREKMERLGI